MDSLFHSLSSPFLGLKNSSTSTLAITLKIQIKKYFLFFSIFSHYLGNQTVQQIQKKMSFQAQNFPRRKKSFSLQWPQLQKNFLLYQQQSFLLLIFFFFLESLRWQLLLQSWPMHRRRLPCRLLPPPMPPKIGPSSFMVIFFSTTSSQNWNRKSKLSFSSSDSHFCVCFCFYSDFDWFVWRFDSTSLVEITGLIFDFGVLWQRSTSFSGKKLWFFSFFIVFLCSVFYFIFLWGFV